VGGRIAAAEMSDDFLGKKGRRTTTERGVSAAFQKQARRKKGL